MSELPKIVFSSSDEEENNCQFGGPFSKLNENVSKTMEVMNGKSFQSLTQSSIQNDDGGTVDNSHLASQATTLSNDSIHTQDIDTSQSILDSSKSFSKSNATVIDSLLNEIKTKQREIVCKLKSGCTEISLKAARDLFNELQKDIVKVNGALSDERKIIKKCRGVDRCVDSQLKEDKAKLMQTAKRLLAQQKMLMQLLKLHKQISCELKTGEMKLAASLKESLWKNQMKSKSIYETVVSTDMKNQPEKHISSSIMKQPETKIQTNMKKQPEPIIPTNMTDGLVITSSHNLTPANKIPKTVDSKTNLKKDKVAEVSAPLTVSNGPPNNMSMRKFDFSRRTVMAASDLNKQDSNANERKYDFAELIRNGTMIPGKNMLTVKVEGSLMHADLNRNGSISFQKVTYANLDDWLSQVLGTKWLHSNSIEMVKCGEKPFLDLLQGNNMLTSSTNEKSAKRNKTDQRTRDASNVTDVQTSDLDERKTPTVGVSSDRSSNLSARFVRTYAQAEYCRDILPSECWQSKNFSSVQFTDEFLYNIGFF